MAATPICKKCKSLKTLCSNGISKAYRCISCRKQQIKEYQQRPEVKEVRKLYHSSLKMKQKRKEWRKLQRKNNLEFQKQERLSHNKYIKNRKQNDINFKLRVGLRIRLNKALKNNFKIGSAVRDLGCSIEQLKQHLESKFTQGMSWKNYGQWHIDHIIPLSKVNLTNREQFLKVNNYMNLQPLWAEDNIRKGNKNG